ncbi:hypothetical protein CDD83_5019 [Cordyceps sp. RAO-2017]|nr:hypothetical protein CDD83_5019 [Cordyceps sp. RAO-2017]
MIPHDDAAPSSGRLVFQFRRSASASEAPRWTCRAAVRAAAKFLGALCPVPRARRQYGAGTWAVRTEPEAAGCRPAGDSPRGRCHIASILALPLLSPSSRAWAGSVCDAKARTPLEFLGRDCKAYLFGPLSFRLAPRRQRLPPSRKRRP